MRDASRAKNSTAKAGHGKNPPGLLSSRPPAAEDATGRAMASETSPRSAAKSIAARSRMLREKGRTRLVNRRPGPPPTWTTAVVSSRPRPEGRRHMPAPRGAGELRPPFFPGGTARPPFFQHTAGNAFFETRPGRRTRPHSPRTARKERDMVAPAPGAEYTSSSPSCTLTMWLEI